MKKHQIFLTGRGSGRLAKEIYNKIINVIYIILFKDVIKTLYILFLYQLVGSNYTSHTPTLLKYQDDYINEYELYFGQSRR